MIEFASMNWRNRGTFWLTVMAVLALVCVPSIDWIGNLDAYRRCLTGWQPAPLKTTRTSYTPRENRDMATPPVLTAVEFRMKAPKAKSVELVGDFNAWKPGLLRLARMDGKWSLFVPLPRGRHKYLYLVDGEPVIEAGAPTEDGPMGRRVSVKVVR